MQASSARERQLKNDKYDEAVDVSQSMDQSAVMGGGRAGGAGGAKSQAPSAAAAASSAVGKPAVSASDEKTNSYLNKPFDEALEFSQSSSGESIDTRGSQRPKKSSTEAKQSAPPAQQVLNCFLFTFI
jgi:hypothetical protein